MIFTKNKGFTLIELLIVVAIISMTMAIGLPSFQSIIIGNRLSSAANAMVNTLQLARMEALNKHKSVYIQNINGSWQNGWIVFVDTNGNTIQDTADSSENTFATFDAISPTITPKNTLAALTSFYYDASKQSSALGKFSFCTPTGDNQDFRSVVITLTGRIHVESTSTTPSSTYAADCN